MSAVIERAPLVRRTAGGGTLAALISAAVLMWRGRQDSRSAAAPVNAISHWIWPRSAMARDDASLRYTGTGGLVHLASSMLWSAIYGGVRMRRRYPTAMNAVTDAAAVSALAAVVDLKLVPERLTPGFQHRLSDRSLLLVYAGFGLGLALSGLAALRR